MALSVHRPLLLGRATCFPVSLLVMMKPSLAGILSRELHQKLYEELYTELFEHLFNALYVTMPEEEEYLPQI